MAKTRVTLTIDQEVLKAVEKRASRMGKSGNAVIEEAIRRHLGLDPMERLWARNNMAENDAMELALEAQEEARRQTRH